MHEDDWRQLELVASTHRGAISDNLAAIRELRSESSGFGFERIHVREEPKAPLLGLQLDLGALAKALGSGFGQWTAVAFNTDPRRVIGAFAYVGSTSTVYGTEQGGLLKTLGVHLASEAATPDTGVTALMRLADQYNAYVVDWTAARSYPDLTEQ